MKRLYFTLCFMVGMCGGVSAETYLHVLATPTPIQTQAGPDSAYSYLTNEGSVFKVLDKVGEYYKIQLPVDEVGYIHYRFGQLFAGSVEEDSLLNAPLSMASLDPIDYNPNQFAPQENYRFPRRPRNRNVDLDVDGFYEFKLSGRDFSPKIVTDSRWETIINDPIYNKIPKDVLLGPMQFEMRYKIGIDGKLDDNLSLHYDIEQEPDFPGKYDVQVKYKQHELTFYHFDAEYNNGEYINVRKALNGAKYQTYNDNLEYIVATGKERSEPQKFESNGTGQKTIKLGNTSILEDSVRVWVNNHPLQKGVDYDINYFQGEISFTNPPQQTDFIKVVYEFTNPIEDFLPILSRKNFFGTQVKWRSDEKIERQSVMGTATETLWSKSLFLDQVASLKSTAPAPTPTVNLESLIADMIAQELSGTGVTESIGVIPVTLPDIPTPDVRIPDTFFLKNIPLSLGEEHVYLNGFELERNKDYFIRNRTGRLTLARPLNSDDTLEVRYTYYFVQSFQEDFIAKNSPGPYPFKHHPVVDGTVSVWMNDAPLTEVKDYLVDADKGELYFNYPVEYPTIISITYDAIDTQLVTINSGSNKFNFGVTYLEENVRSQAEELTLSVVSENHTLVTTNVLTVNNNPIINPTELVISKDGQRLATSDYTIKNAYTGEIEFLNPVFGNLLISYKYKKSTLSKSYFRITTPREGLAYETPTDFQLTDVPVQYDGVEYIELFQASTQQTLKLSPGFEFVVDYGDTGEEITIRFIKNEGNNGSFLTQYPKEGDNLTIVYNYTPPDSRDSGDLNQRMIGITAGTQLTDHWSIQTEIAAADHNFSKPREQGGTALGSPILGTGQPNAVYTLPNSNIVEDSESIFIKNAQTNSRLNKNVDYFINYSRGELRFRNLTPGPNDEIVATYEYFTNDGTTQTGQKQNFKYATKLSTHYQNEGFKTNLHYKSIDKEFLPIGDIQETRGSTVLGGDMNWDISTVNSMFTSYNRRKEDKGTKEDNSKKFLTSDELNSRINYRFLNYFDTDHSLHYTFSLEDPFEVQSPTVNHPVDTIAYTLQSSAKFGPEFWRWQVLKGTSKEITDYVDQLDPRVTLVNTHAYSSTLHGRHIYLLQDVLLNPYYDNSLSSTEISNAQEGTYTNRQNYGLNSTYKPLRGLTTQVNYNFSDAQSSTSKLSTPSITESMNTAYLADYSPVSWFSMNWAKRHSESESPLLNQKGLVSDSVDFKISRYSLYGMMTANGAPHTHFAIRPFKDSYLSYSSSKRGTKENDLRNNFTSQRDQFGIYRFEPLAGITLHEWSFNTYNAFRNNTVGSTTSSADITDQFTQNERGKITVDPKLPILNHFSYTFDFDQRDETTVTKRLAQTVTSSITTDEKPSFKRNQRLSFTSGPLVLFRRLNLGSFTTYVQENWADEVLSTTTDQFAIGELDKQSPSIASTNLQENSSFSKLYTLGLSASPFNLFSFNSVITSSNTLLKRNITQNPGLTLKLGRTYDFNAAFSPFRFLTIDGYYRHNRAIQYRSPSLNVSERLLKSTDPRLSSGSITDALDRLTLSRSLGASFYPFKFITFTGRGTHETISEGYISQTDSSFQGIEKHQGSLGTILKPLKTLNIGYTYSINRYTESGVYSIGQEGVTEITYRPISKENFKVDLSYTRTDNWGKGINEIQQQSSEQGSGDIIQTEIVERNDTVEIGSLQMNITIPMKRSPYIENIVITGEGYLKSVTDRLDPSHESNNEPLGSFNITGLILKSTINF